ncbi:PLD nuclease N-terminal domain-containing protein [uncultured Cocleimonas sp.]|uniref:PLD nuclease N-terminal domain-containing protein n=1 Tax=uncultured Cocleimonas sp. TaxID=1051587 RepID=UPI00261E67F8|nr:PLD nuclease N-terminal domain-containing protein [uncultured Cocleimonas sp.]
MGIEVGGIFGLIVLILDILAIIKVMNSGTSTGGKLLWTLIIVFLPVLGLIVWFFAGPKS